MSERRLTTNILKTLRQRWPEAWWIKVHGGPMQQGGIPDIIGCVNGQLVGLEVKLPGGGHGVTDLQAHTMKQIRLAGGIAVVVTSVAEAEDLVTTLTG